MASGFLRVSMKHFAATACCVCGSRGAQTKGRVSVGGTVSFVQPGDSEVGSLVGFGPLVRLNPRRGWGVAGGLSWFRADLDNPSRESSDHLRIDKYPLVASN